MSQPLSDQRRTRMAVLCMCTPLAFEIAVFCCADEFDGERCKLFPGKENGFCLCLGKEGFSPRKAIAGQHQRA